MQNLNLLVFLLRDDFLTDEGTPLVSPRTAEPGPRSWDIVDTANKLSISSGRLQFAGRTGGSDPFLFLEDSIARAGGLGFFGLFQFPTNARFRVGWAIAQGQPSLYSFRLSQERLRLTLTNETIFDVLADIDHNYAIILRNIGAFIVLRDESDWKLLWVYDADATANLFVNIGIDATDSTTEHDNLRLTQLPAPWNTDDGIATDTVNGVAALNDTYIHEADFLGEFIVTAVPTVGTIFFSFRRQDPTNYWEVIVEPNQDITLREVVASVPTARGTSAGVVNNGDRIVIVADGLGIDVFRQNVNEISYGAAANFRIETDGEVLGVGDGVMSDIKTWPRVLTGAAKSALDRIANTV